MKDYTATITIIWNFKAKNEEQANERGYKLKDSVALLWKAPEKQPNWIGDLEDIGVRVTEI